MSPITFRVTDSLGGTSSKSLDLAVVAAPSPCPGDCDASGEVTIGELITGVAIALGTRDISDCTRVDGNGNGTVTIEEFLQAVNQALRGCGV